MNLTTLDQVSSAINPWTVISGIIGILGFMIAVINLIHYFVTRRVHIEILILNYEMRVHIDKQILIRVQYLITNKSSLPVSVTQFGMVVNDKALPPDNRTHTLEVYRYVENNKVTDRIPIYNTHTPVNLREHSAETGDFVYLVPQETKPDFENGMTFEIRSNRNQALRMKLEPKVSYKITRRNILRKDVRSR